MQDQNKLKYIQGQLLSEILEPVRDTEVHLFETLPSCKTHKQAKAQSMAFLNVIDKSGAAVYI